MHHNKDINKGDMYFSSSDIGWVVGHSFIVYGPLIRGATTILYEVYFIIKGKTKYSKSWYILEFD